MSWTALFHDAFDGEFNELPETVQDELLAQAKLLEGSDRHSAGPAWTRSMAPTTRI